MIKVNLVGASRKKAAKKSAGTKIAMPTSIVPIVLLLIVVATVAGGYLWYSSLDARAKQLDADIAAAQALKASLDAVIKTNQVYEGRKKMLESRIQIVEGLKRNKVNPVRALDVLSEAIERTQYVWLSQLDQNNAILSMAGVGTSLSAISDFVQNLESSGYFRNTDFNNATDAAGNFTFSLKCEFAPPPPTATQAPATTATTPGGDK
jgi:Tfp pilus assembly protein PilN